MTVTTCPICGVRFEFERSDAAPFCSPRCRRIDLKRWLNEEYSVPSAPSDEDEELDPDLTPENEDE